MTLKNHVEILVNQLPGQPTFIYGADEDANIILDDVTHWPVVVMLDKVSTTGVRQMSNSASLSTDILMFFINKCDFLGHPDESEIIQGEMLILANQFFVKLGYYRDSGNNKVFDTKPGDEYQCEPITQEFDVNVCGQSFETKLKPMYPTSFCE